MPYTKIEFTSAFTASSKPRCRRHQVNPKDLLQAAILRADLGKSAAEIKKAIEKAATAQTRKRELRFIEQYLSATK